MTQSWKGENNYICPPWRMLNQIVNKIRQENCDATLIAPLWPSAPWFPILLRLSSDLCYISSRNILPAHSLGNAEPLKNNKWKLAAFRISGKSTQTTGTLKPALFSRTH